MTMVTPQEIEMRVVVDSEKRLTDMSVLKAGNAVNVSTVACVYAVVLVTIVSHSSLDDFLRGTVSFFTLVSR